MTDHPIKHVADQARNAWMRSQAGGAIGSALRVIGASNAVDVIYIVEYASGDWDNALFIGDSVQVWAYRGDEFEELEALGDLDLENPIASQTPVIRYCLASDGQRMIHTTWNGCRAGYGHILRRIDDDWKSQGRSWIS